LAFLDNGITWHIVNHPSNKISHGDAYNYDTIISAIMIAVNSLLGLPWLVASTVPCIMHVTAMSEKTKDGETLSIQESRLTGFFTHILVLGTIFTLSVIKLIPLPVLYGVFLFMGLVALPAQQYWQRLLLFFQQPSQYASTPYTDNLSHKRIHLFTACQVVLFAMLYAVKNVKAVAIAFPIMILLCIPVRLYLLPRVFDEKELILLDGSPEEIEKWLYHQSSPSQLSPSQLSPKKNRELLKANPTFQAHMTKNGLRLPSFNEEEEDVENSVVNEVDDFGDLNTEKEELKSC
jgi:hypothetical protein